MYGVTAVLKQSNVWGAVGMTNLFGSESPPFLGLGDFKVFQESLVKKNRPDDFSNIIINQDVI